MTARDVQHRISELLDERGWSPTHLVKVVGVPTSTITDIFKRDSYPTLPLIEKIADAFDITVGEFFSFDIPPVSSDFSQYFVPHSISFVRRSVKKWKG